MGFLNNIKSVLGFWKRKPRTEISQAMFSRLRSSQPAEKEAAAKVIKFGKRHFVSPEDFEELYQAELEYEQKKYKARHDFPHQTEIRKADIEVAKKEKYIRIMLCRKSPTVNIGSIAIDFVKNIRRKHNKKEPKHISALFC
jgi:hypothetical protein